MDDAKPSASPPQDEELKEVMRKREEIIQNLDVNEIPPFMVDHHVKGLQMFEDRFNDWRLTEFPDENKVKLAVKVWCQGYMFNDRIRMMVAEKYVEAMRGLKRKGSSELIEHSKVAAAGEYNPNAPPSQQKKPGIFERIKRVF